MAAVNEAWRVLSDPGRRAMYDAGLRRSSPGSAPAATSRAWDDSASYGADGLAELNDDAEFVSAPPWKHRMPFWAMFGLGAMAVIFVVTAYAGSAAGPGTNRAPAVGGTLVVGSCARLAPGGLVEAIECQGVHEGVVAALIDYDGRCPAGTSGYRRHDGVIGYACLRRD